MFIIVLHVIVCIGLIGIVLIQRGRGSGLVESFAGVESMFGTKTSAFLTRTTTVLSILFFLTCLSLAILSIKQSRSLMRDIRPEPLASETAPAGVQPPAAEQAKETAAAGAQTATTEPATEAATAGAQAPFTQPMPDIAPQAPAAAQQTQPAQK